MKLVALALFMTGCAAAPVVPPAAPVLPVMPERIAATDGAIWTPQAPSLFEDQRARRAGDVLTVVLVEQTAASKKATTSTSRDSSVEVANPTLFGRPLSVNGTGVGGFGLESGKTFSGNGNASQSNTLQGSVTVMVTQVLANGNLVIRGEKNLEINQGAERVALEGIVRPQDVSPGNTVTSDRVAAARISYSGSGALADANREGWLSRFFSSALWPF